MKKHPPKKIKKGKRIIEKTKPVYRAWGLAARSEHIKNREKRK